MSQTNENQGSKAPTERSTADDNASSNRRWRSQREWLRNQNLPSEELQKIREEAYTMWNKRPVKSRSSYNDHYFWKNADSHSRPNSAPLDKPYRNRPHPNVEFLVTRMHDLPGYFYQPSDSTRDSATSEAGSQKPTVRIGRGNAYITATELHLQKLSAEAKPQQDMQWEPSLYRYMKIAGQEERERIEQAIRRARVGAAERAQQIAYSRRFQFPPSTTVQAMGKECDIVGSGYGFRPEQKPQTIYGFNKDFVIHPDWPPTLNHHTVP